MRKKFTFPEWPGIYLIWNKEEEKGYIGSSVSVCERLKSHWKCLHQHKCTIKLQRAWNKYGEEAFEVIVLEVIYYKKAPKNKKKRLKLRKKLIKKGQFWIDYYDAVDDGYNIAPKAGSTLGMEFSFSAKPKISEALTGRKLSKDTKNKISIANIGNTNGRNNKGKKCTEKTKKKMSKAHKGHKVSKKTRKKISIANTGKVRSDSVKRKLSEIKKKNPVRYWKGRKMSVSQRKKLSIAHIGIFPSKKTVLKMSRSQKRRYL